jgi:hypothetical protein
MDTAQKEHTVREAVGVFHDQDALLSAVDELTSSGFDRAELNLLAADRAIEEKLGQNYQKVQELEDDATVPRAAFVGTHSVAEGKTAMVGGLAYVGAVAAAGAVVASGGTLAGAIAAAAVAGGGAGLLGGVGARMLGRDRAQSLKHQLDRGGLLLWVHCRDAAHEARAIEILTQNGGEDVHVHDLPASKDPDDNPLSGWEIDPFLPGSRF